MAGLAVPTLHRCVRLGYDEDFVNAAQVRATGALRTARGFHRAGTVGAALRLGDEGYTRIFQEAARSCCRLVVGRARGNLGPMYSGEVSISTGRAESRRAHWRTRCTVLSRQPGNVAASAVAGRITTARADVMSDDSNPGSIGRMPQVRRRPQHDGQMIALTTSSADHRPAELIPHPSRPCVRISYTGQAGDVLSRVNSSARARHMCRRMSRCRRSGSRSRASRCLQHLAR